MKSLLTVFLATITLATFSLAQTPAPARPADRPKLPTAQEILTKYVAAIGGREANEKVKTRSVKGDVELRPMGVKGTFESIAAAPDRSASRIKLAGIGEFVDIYDGKSSWSSNPIQGSRERTGDELAQVKLLNNFHRDINLDKLYSKFEVKGVEKVNGKEAYVVQAETGSLPPTTFYFDAASGLLLRQDSTAITPEGRSPVQTFFEETKMVDGILTVTRVRTVLPTGELVLTTTETKINIDIPDSQFARPK